MAITQTIATLPAVLNDSATFYEDIAERNNSLVTTVLPSINAWASQANDLAVEVNDKAAQVAAQAVDGGYSQVYINSNFVGINNAQTIAGIKTFSANPISSAAQSSSVNALTRRDFVTTLDAQNIKLSGNQTIAGVKTFSVSPIVPTPTTDFQPVPLKSTNITVDVGTGQTYTTINQALEYLSGFYPMYKKSGITVTINLKAGFVMAEQVLVSGIDLGWITIVGEDAETIITHTALTTTFNGYIPAFGIDKSGASPVIGQLFRFNVEKVGGDKHGLMTYGAGSSATILPSCGFIGAGTYGIFATNSSIINANSTNFSSAGNSGIFAYGGSTVTAQSANCSNAGSTGMSATQSSIINANGAIIQNQTTGTARVRVVDGSHIEASNIDATGGTVPVLSQTANTLTQNGIIYQ